MSSYLNPYQTAILQEMGICIWQSQSGLTEDAKPENAEASPANQSREAEITSAGVAPSAVNGQARIAQLRSMLGNKDDKKAVDKPTSWSQSETQAESKPQVAQSPAQPQAPVPETIEPHSFGQIGRDILLALSLFHDGKAIRWQYGSELSLKENTLTLPYKTAPTHAADKRRLWQVISAK